MQKLDAFQRWALATTGATYLLIAVGGLVRAAGAGLGCPDWPKCFDRWIPPTDISQVPPSIDPALFNVTKAWIEYVNRLIGVAVGLLIFVTLVLAIRQHRREPRILGSTIAAFLLVGFEGWLGGQVVAAKLAPLVLSAHLACALVIGGLLSYATVCAFFPEGRPIADLPPWRRAIGRATSAVLALALIQVSLGAFVRGEAQSLGKANVPRELWIGQIGSIYNVHANFAVIVAIAIAALSWFILDRAKGTRWLRKSAAAAIGLLILQALAGIGLAQLDFLPALQVAHLWIGSLLIAALTVIVLLAFRLEPMELSATSASIAEGASIR